MTFFNKKEEVINLELTPYGRQLLAKGNFNVKYYEFHDDDVVYDSEYIGFTEEQEDIQVRIKQTPTLKPFYSFDSADSRIKENNDGDSPSVKSKTFSLTSIPLGKSLLNTNKSTNTKIRTFNTHISSSQFEDIYGLPKSVKQINLEKNNIDIKLRQKNEQEENISSLQQQDKEIHNVNIDGKLIEIVKTNKYIFLEFIENGVEYNSENFEITFYEIIKDEKTQKDVEKQLEFVKPIQQVVNNILVDNVYNLQQQEQITEEYAEYSFNILTDKEVPGSVLCEHLSEQEINNLKSIEGYIINCEVSDGDSDAQNRRMYRTEQDITIVEEC